MAVATSVLGSASSGSTLVLTFTYTPLTVASGDTAAMAVITLIPAPATAPTVTLGGSTMTLIGTVVDTVQINGKMYFYGMVNPPVGSASLVATWTTTSSRWIANACTFVGTDTTGVATAFGNYSGTDNTTSATNLSQVTTTSNAGSNVVMSGITIGAAGSVSSRTDTAWFDIAEGSLMRVDVQYATGTSGSSHTGSWVLSVSEYTMNAGVEVNPPGGGGGGAALAGQLTQGTLKRPGAGPVGFRPSLFTSSYPPPPVVVTPAGGATLPMMGVG